MNQDTPTQESLDVKPIADAELSERYAINTPSAINKLIRAVDTEENEIYIHLGVNGTVFVSELLKIETTPQGTGHLWVATPLDKSILFDLSPETEVIVVAFPEGIKVQLHTTAPEYLELDKTKAIRLPMPHKAIRLQRRSYFRVMIDSSLKKSIEIPHPKLTNQAELIDLSMAGCGLSVEAGLDDFQIGQSLGKAQLTLPVSNIPLPVSLKVKNVKMNPEHSESIVIGCEMNLLHKPDAARLQRFLLASEREQRTANRKLV